MLVTDVFAWCRLKIKYKFSQTRRRVKAGNKQSVKSLQQTNNYPKNHFNVSAKVVHDNSLKKTCQISVLPEGYLLEMLKTYFFSLMAGYYVKLKFKISSCNNCK